MDASKTSMMRGRGGKNKRKRSVSDSDKESDNDTVSAKRVVKKKKVDEGVTMLDAHEGADGQEKSEEE